MMTHGERTSKDRIGPGTTHALNKTYQPDDAADDRLASLIGQLNRLPWPRTTNERKFK